MDLRQGIENAFGAWANLVWRRHWYVIGGVLAIAADLGTGFSKLEIDTSTENFLLDSDPVKIAYDGLRERFGRDQLVLLAIEPPKIFERSFLEKLCRLHAELEETIPHLEDVTSLINVRSTYGRGDELVVGELLETLPATQQELDALRERVLRTPSYLGSVISEDGRVASVIIKTDAYSSTVTEAEVMAGFGDEGEGGKRAFLTPEEDGEIIAAVHEIVSRYRAPEFQIEVAGSVLLPYELMGAMQREMPKFFAGSLAAIAIFLFLLFRRITAVLLALGVVVLAVASTLGLTSLLDFKLTLASQITPSFLLAVGVGYSVHVLAIFLQRFDAEGDRQEALVYALRHSGLPILMTGITTVAGLLSFQVAELRPVKEFGVVTAIGVGMTLAYALVLLPALLAALPLRPRPRADGKEVRNRALIWAGGLWAGHPWKAVMLTAILTLASLYSATNVRFSSNPLSYLPPEHPFRVATLYIDERMGGSMTLEVLVDGKVENALHEPELLNRLEAIRERAAEYRAEGLNIRRTASILDIAKETHQALNENRPEFYSIPQDRELLAQELLLFENSGSEHLEEVVDSSFSLTRMTIRTDWADGLELAALVDRATVEFRELMDGDAELIITGIAALMTRTVRATTSSLTRSYLLALVLITPLMMLLIGSLRSGLVSMVPNLTPIVMTLGLMPLVGITLDMFTLMMGCIAIGLAVDDTIHFIHSYRRYLDQTRDPIRSVELALNTTGRALLFTSMVLSLGFFVFVFSTMGNLRDFGLLTAFAIATAFIIDLMVTPALMVLVSRAGALGHRV